MKIGVKSYCNKEFLDYFQDKADFLEIQAIEGNNYDFLKNYNIPIIIHAQHSFFGINFADISKKEKNLKSINFAIKLAEMVNSKKIIQHPGAIENKNCSEENSLKLLKEINDSRIIIENLPEIDKRLCTTPDSIKEFLKNSKQGFCFDLSHLIVSTNILKLDLIDSIKKCLKLNPKHFHISGQKLKSKVDQHLSIQEGDIDFKKILRLYPRDAEITLEVSRDINQTERDLEKIRKILEKIN